MPRPAPTGPAGGRDPRAAAGAVAASILVHAGLAGLVTLSPAAFLSPPRIEVPEAIPVELVLDRAERDRMVIPAGLPSIALRPSSSGAAAMPVGADAALRPAGMPPPSAPAPPFGDASHVVKAPPDLARPELGPASAPVVATAVAPAPLREPDVALTPASPPAATPVQSDVIVPNALSALTGSAPAIVVEAAQPDRAVSVGPKVVAATRPAPAAGPTSPALALAPSAATAAPAAARISAPLLSPALGPTRPAPPAILAALPDARALRPADPRPELAAILSGFACARIGARYEPADGTLTLAGHAASAADRERAIAALGGVAGVGRVEARALGIVGEPYCRLLDALATPALRRSTEQRDELPSIGTGNMPAVRRLVGGEPLRLTLAAPDFDSHLYVDYFAADGSVVHLLPVERDVAVGAKATVRLGETAGRRAVVAPPYGLDIVLVIASSTGLPIVSRPPSEAGERYLADLTAAIAAAGPDARFEYAYYLLETAPPGSRTGLR